MKKKEEWPVGTVSTDVFLNYFCEVGRDAAADNLFLQLTVNLGPQNVKII